MRSGLFGNLSKVTEKAAIAASGLIGKRNKIAVDRAAVDAMREAFATINMGGRVVVGEGEKDEAPSFIYGEKVGIKSKNEIDLAIDPIEGTEFAARDKANAVAVLAAVEKGKLLEVPDVYMNKIIVGPRAKGKVSLLQSTAENLQAVAKAKDESVSDLTVAVLDRPRHEDIINQIKQAGANVKLISGVDVIWGIATAKDEFDIDMLIGIGGAPEGILTAAAIKCLGGGMEAQLSPRNNLDINKIKQFGIDDVDQIYDLDNLVSGEEIIFSMTGVTDGILLSRVKEQKTHSLIMSKSSSGASYIRELKTDHGSVNRLKIS